MAHLDPVRLVEYLRGDGLDESDRQHLDGCGRCGRALEGVRTLLRGTAEGAANSKAEAAEDGRDLPSGAAGNRARLGEIAALSEKGEALGRELLEAAASNRAEEVLRSLQDHPSRGYALSTAAQHGARLAVRDPGAAFRLALLIRAEASVPSTEPVSAAHVKAEALLLESQALLNLGSVALAIKRAREARDEFESVGPDPFAAALCDYFEASAAGYASDYALAERLLKRAAKTFSEFGQEHWTGRALLALGTVLSQRGDDERALEYLGQGLLSVDPREDANAYAAALVNKASVLAHLERFDEARADYARALKVALESGFQVLVHHVQLGLAEIDFLGGNFQRALEAYVRLTEQARERGYVEQLRFAMLYTAECLARLGQLPAAEAALHDLRREIQEHPFQSVALEDLFACLDKGDVNAGLIASVRDHLENPDRPYQIRRTG